VLYEAVLNGGTETVTFETLVMPQHYMTILKDTGPGRRLKVGSLFTSLPTCKNVSFPNTLCCVVLNHKHMNFINITAEITKWQMYRQNTTIFISYEWVDHIAVHNYMFGPLSAIVRLYYSPVIK